jgi:hypothetical protein
MAACVAMLANISEECAIKLCQTKKSGTSLLTTRKALYTLNKTPHIVYLDLSIEECWFFHNWKHPTIIVGEYETRYYQRGRPKKRCHSFLLDSGMIYDPSEKREFPLEAYFHIFDKLFIYYAIIVENA